MDSLAAIGGLLIALSTPVGGAPQQPAPSLVIGGFTLDGVKVSDKDLDAVADELAAQLVESGRFRVLDRSLLPVAGSAKRPSLAQLRDAAVHAGLKYVVIGTVSKSVETQRYPLAGGPRLPSTGSPLARRGFPAPAFTYRTPYLNLLVKLVDAKTGAVLMQATERRPASRVSRALEQAVQAAGAALIYWHPGATSQGGLS